jgi:hypothetical protein
MSTRTLFVSSILVLALALSARPASADDPNRVFAGKIIMAAKRFPQKANSPNAYIAQIRKMSQSNFVEDKADHTWTIYLAGFLKTPLNDLEYSLKVYELTGNSQQLLVTADQYTDERGQKTIITKVKLEKKSVGVNKQIMLTIESKGRVLASGLCKILGEGERYSGKVNFSEDEAGGKDDDDDAKKK